MIIGNNLHVDAFYDEATSTISYLVMDRETRQCALIDSVLDYDPKSGRTCSASADRLIERVNELNASVRWVLETHVHADHLSAAAYLKEKLGGHTAIGAHITQVQKVFGALFNAEPGFARDGSQFDVLLEDEEGFRIGNLQARALHTPGHTPACMSFMIEDAGEIAVFVGDTLFMPDYGTARCDFPGADARTLYRSIRRLLAFPIRLGCSCATTTCQVAATCSTSLLSPSSAPTTFTSTRVSTRTASWPCAKPATRRSKCRC